VKYTNASTSNASSFSWAFPGGSPSTSTEENVTVIYESAGVYSASLSVTSLNDMNTTTQSDIVTVLSAPMVSFNASITGSTITLENTSTDATSIEWDFGDGNKSTDTNPDYEYEAGGVYTVTLTATNECGTTTISKDINIVLSNTNEISSIDEFIVYPNPSSGVFFLDLKSSKSTSLNLSVIDLEGRQVYSSIEKLSANLGFTKSFDLPNLAQSTYLLVIQSEDGKMVKKINIVE
jgi:PKD repeat protein